MLHIHVENVSKSSKGALIKEKSFWHFLISSALSGYTSFHINEAGVIGCRPCPRTWRYFLRALKKNP